MASALIQTAELDVLRDEGEAYAHKLDRAGVDVTSTRYNGLIHDYGLLNPLSHVPGVRSALLDASTALKNCFAEPIGTGRGCHGRFISGYLRGRPPRLSTFGPTRCRWLRGLLASRSIVMGGSWRLACARDNRRPSVIATFGDRSLGMKHT